MKLKEIQLYCHLLKHTADTPAIATRTDINPITIPAISPLERPPLSDPEFCVWESLLPTLQPLHVPMEMPPPEPPAPDSDVVAVGK